LQVEQFEWNGRRIEVTCVALARKLWMTCSIDVHWQGRCVLRTGGQFKDVGSQTATFDDAGRSRLAELTFGEIGDGGFPYTLRIDGQEIRRGTVAIQNPKEAKLGLLVAIALVIAMLVKGALRLFG
jgi:hypothetical protein